MTVTRRKPRLFEALLPILILVSLLALNVIIFEQAALDGSNQLALLFSAAIAGIIGYRMGFTYDEMQDGVVRSISTAISAILILLMIGALAGTWLLSGIVPTMIYYGLEVLNPTIFLFASCIICSVVSLATGSSWSTVATVGIALLGIGQALGLSEGLIAGSIISGAYFGDKMSPLSDTTNLAPAVAGTDLFSHIRYMMWTTVPSIVIALIIYLAIGLTNDPSGIVANVAEVQQAIAARFYISGWLFLVPAAVIAMIILKVPALPALMVGTLLGGVFAFIFQPEVVGMVAGIADDPWVEGYVAVMKAMYAEISVPTGNAIVDELLTTGGMSGMLNTIWLILSAMVFGGVMESTGMLQRITESIISWAQSTGSLVASTAATCIFFNLTASDQYLAIVVPGRMYAETYRKRGLCPENLSRTLEDSATVTSVLVPWNTCGLTQASVLGVATIVYLPYAFFNLISPIMTVLVAYLNIKIARYPASESLEKSDALVNV